MIPPVKAWKAQFTDDVAWIVWAPTKLLARLNLQSQGLTHPRTVARYKAADELPVPASLVQPFQPFHTLPPSQVAVTQLSAVDSAKALGDLGLLERVELWYTRADQNGEDPFDLLCDIARTILTKGEK